MRGGKRERVVLRQERKERWGGMVALLLNEGARECKLTSLGDSCD